MPPPLQGEDGRARPARGLAPPATRPSPFGATPGPRGRWHVTGGVNPWYTPTGNGIPRPNGPKACSRGCQPVVYNDRQRIPRPNGPKACNRVCPPMGHTGREWSRGPTGRRRVAGGVNPRYRVRTQELRPERARARPAVVPDDVHGNNRVHHCPRPFRARMGGARPARGLAPPATRPRPFGATRGPRGRWHVTGGVNPWYTPTGNGFLGPTGRGM